MQIAFFLEVRGHRRQCPGEDLAGRAVDGDRVALLQRLPAHSHDALLEVDVELAHADHARQPQPTSDDRGVARRATARGEDACGRDHAVEVIRRGLGPDEHHELALALHLDGAIGLEHGPAHRRTG